MARRALAYSISFRTLNVEVYPANDVGRLDLARSFRTLNVEVYP